MENGKQIQQSHERVRDGQGAAFESVERPGSSFVTDRRGVGEAEQIIVTAIIFFVFLFTIGYHHKRNLKEKKGIL